MSIYTRQKSYIRTLFEDKHIQYTSVPYFLTEVLTGNEALVLSFIMSIENIPNVKRLAEDTDYFQVIFYVFKNWPQNVLGDTLESLENKGLINFKVLNDKDVVVKLNKAKLDELKQYWLDARLLYA